VHRLAEQRDLPHSVRMQPAAAIVIVIATILVLFATSSVIAGWADRRWPWGALAAVGIGVGLWIYAHLVLKPEGLIPRDIPDAFINVAAMVLN